MATLASSPPTSPSWPKRRPRAWALRCERYCCAAASCFPLAFVYGITTWAVYVAVSIGIRPSRSDWIGMQDSAWTRTRMYPGVLTCRQVSQAPSSHFPSTPSSTFHIPLPFSPIQGRRSLPLAEQTIMSTAPSLRPSTRSSHHIPSPRLVNHDTAKNASVRSRTAHTTAQRANDVS